MIDDPEIQEIAKAQRKKTLTRVGIAVAVVVVAALSIVPMGGAVASALEADGYTNVKVERDGLFEFEYEAEKDGASCTGRYTKMPGSSSQSGMCITQKSE